MAITYNNLFLRARAVLREKGIENAQLEAREIVCFAADKTKAQLYRDLSLYASDQTQQRVESLLQRRIVGEPVAYIVGEWEFYGLPLDITRDVLIPRIDTEILVERALSRLQGMTPQARILDLCAGSGCVGLAIASKMPQVHVVLGDNSDGALRLCKQNVRRSDLTNRVTCVSVDAMEVPAAALWDFDMIVCNPPYIKSKDIETLDDTVKNFEPLGALDGGEDGLDFYRFIIPKWKKALRAGGALLFEVGIGQAPMVEEMFSAAQYEQIQTTTDSQGIWRVVEATANG